MVRKLWAGSRALSEKRVLDLTRAAKSSRPKRARRLRDRAPRDRVSYQLLERIAQRAGDEEISAEVARQNRGDEEAMARKL